MKNALIYFVLTCLFFNAPALAGEASKSIEIKNPWTRPTQKGQNAIIFMQIYNTSNKPDKLIKIDSPVASQSELHAHSTNTQGITSMSKLSSIPIPAKGYIGLTPDGQLGLQGVHGMLIHVNRNLVANKDVIPVRLTFETGEINISVPVKNNWP